MAEQTQAPRIGTRTKFRQWLDRTYGWTHTRYSKLGAEEKVKVFKEYQKSRQPGTIAGVPTTDLVV